MGLGMNGLQAWSWGVDSRNQGPCSIATSWYHCHGDTSGHHNVPNTLRWMDGCMHHSGVAAGLTRRDKKGILPPIGACLWCKDRVTWIIFYRNSSLALQSEEEACCGSQRGKNENFFSKPLQREQKPWTTITKVHGQTPTSFGERGSRACVHSSLIAFLHCLCQGINKGLKGRIVRMCLDRLSGETRFGTSLRYVKWTSKEQMLIVLN